MTRSPRARPTGPPAARRVPGAGPMVLERLVRRVYVASGRRHRLVVVAGELVTTTLVAVVSVAVVSRFYAPPLVDVVGVGLVAVVATSLAVTVAAASSARRLRPVERWRSASYPTPQETLAAWRAATSFTLAQYRRVSPFVGVVAVLPTVVVATLVWDLGWAGLGALLVAAVVPGCYGTMLAFSAGELLLRPLVEEIADGLPDEFRFEPQGLPLGWRLRLSVPVYTTTTGTVAAGLLDGAAGSGGLVLTVLVSAGVGLFLSLELTNLLTASVTRPVGVVRAQLARVRDDDYDARVPVVSSDELGELAHDFNQMARGLAEREELREAFGTYVDKEVVRVILSGRFPATGVTVEVSILFCDVRGFTAYAERSEATDVVATLNRLFAEMVPVIEAYGGHVDKFLGDGLMAVFGAPDQHPDHADRAVEAARMLVDVVDVGESGLRVAAGVNSGEVVAGPLGGAGRLNFSVIGDPVNVAARVEAETRRTGDDVLVTAATRALLTRQHHLVSRGPVELKGKTEPVEVFALVPEPSPADGPAVAAGRLD
ncbi:adenylate/guanylate cyclase domain-containing protein [Nocardioides litoris]|uniref:adenylate/guanylate cyclase domain-containing protein n=1 Tax=Nocardioides litoris TaxID=1926648 RepID=UPI00111EC7FA|nr:adenylate/guanylate cyclase domain-containing protein [Nocardioides litoris]